jgi:hypothetical protein
MTLWDLFALIWNSGLKPPCSAAILMGCGYPVVFDIRQMHARRRQSTSSVFWGKAMSLGFGLATNNSP